MAYGPYLGIVAYEFNSPDYAAFIGPMIDGNMYDKEFFARLNLFQEFARAEQGVLKGAQFGFVDTYTVGSVGFMRYATNVDLGLIYGADGTFSIPCGEYLVYGTEGIIDLDENGNHHLNQGKVESLARDYRDLISLESIRPKYDQLKGYGLLPIEDGQLDYTKQAFWSILMSNGTPSDRLYLQ